MAEPLSKETVWLTVAEYAATRKLSESTVRRMITLGTLPIDRVSPRCVRIRMSRVVKSSHQYPGAPSS